MVSPRRARRLLKHKWNFTRVAFNDIKPIWDEKKGSIPKVSKSCLRPPSSNPPPFFLFFLCRLVNNINVQQQILI